MSDELWRVADLKPNAPAHRIVIEREQVRATACNWVPRTPGHLLTRAQMLDLSRFCCIRCASTVGRR